MIATFPQKVSVPIHTMVVMCHWPMHQGLVLGDASLGRVEADMPPVRDPHAFSSCTVPGLDAPASGPGAQSLAQKALWGSA